MAIVLKGMVDLLAFVPLELGYTLIRCRGGKDADNPAVLFLSDSVRTSSCLELRGYIPPWVDDYDSIGAGYVERLPA